MLLSNSVPREQPELESLRFNSDEIVVDAHERNAAANRECGKVSIHPDFGEALLRVALYPDSNSTSEGSSRQVTWGRRSNSAHFAHALELGMGWHPWASRMDFTVKRRRKLVWVARQNAAGWQESADSKTACALLLERVTCECKRKRDAGVVGTSRGRHGLRRVVGSVPKR